MAVEIIQINLGFDQCYVLKADGIIAVDAGAPNQGKSFARGLESVSIQPRDIRLIVITHGHWDHIGSARDIKEMTSAKLAMHYRDASWLEESLSPMPPGVTTWGRILSRVLKIFRPLIHFPPTKVDLPLADDGLPLADYGIPGKVLHTPGHTAGSVSVLLETGEAFVGDLAMNRFPLRLTPGLPILAEDDSQVRNSWKLLLEQGATTIYPAHGKPFPSEIIRRAIS